MDSQPSPALSAMLAQLAPWWLDVLNKISPLLNQPVIRYPYSIPLAQSQVIAAGATAVLNQPDFNYNFEWPFEIQEIGLSQDPAHTTRDWRIAIQDQTFNQPFQKAQSGTMVATLLETNTDKYVLKFPWIIRPKGGGLQITVTNLDQVNPITVDMNLIGAQMIPRGQ